MIPAILQPLGAMTGLLAIGLLLWDRDNGFCFALFPLALVLLGVGLVME